MLPPSLREKGVKSSSASTSAVMAGKLKEKLESVGLALLCLALNTPNPMESWSERWRERGREGEKVGQLLTYMQRCILSAVNSVAGLLM